MKVLQENESLLVFRVGPVACCAPVNDVEAIVTPPAKLTSMPGQAQCIAGIFHHRTETASVLDVRCKFGLPARVDKHTGRLIMVRNTNGLTGFWVDEIVEVTASEQCQWAEPPRLIPQSVFEKTLLYKDELVLYTNFARLRAMADAGAFQTWVGQQQRQGGDSPADAANDEDAKKEEQPIQAVPDAPPVPAAVPQPVAEEQAQPAPLQPVARENASAEPRSDPKPGPRLSEHIAEVTPVAQPADATVHVLPPAERSSQRFDAAPRAAQVVPMPATEPEPKHPPAEPAIAEPPLPTWAEKETKITAKKVWPAPLPTPAPMPERGTPSPSPVIAKRPPPSWIKRDADVALASTTPAVVPEPEPEPKLEPKTRPRPTLVPDAAPPVAENNDAIAKPAPVTPQSVTPPRPVVVVESPKDDTDDLPVVSGPASALDEPLPEHITPVVEVPLPSDQSEGRRSSSLWLVGATVLIAASVAVVWYPSTQTPATHTAKAPPPIVSKPAAPVVVPTEAQPANTPDDAVPVVIEEPVEAKPEPVAIEPTAPQPEPAVMLAEVPAPEIVASPKENPAAKELEVEVEPPAPIVVHAPSPLLPNPLATHIVVNGDTLWHLADQYLHNPFRFPELARMSDIKNPDLIFPGDLVRYRKEEN